MLGDTARRLPHDVGEVAVVAGNQRLRDLVSWGELVGPRPAAGWVLCQRRCLTVVEAAKHELLNPSYETWSRLTWARYVPERWATRVE